MQLHLLRPSPAANPATAGHMQEMRQDTGLLDDLAKPPQSGPAHLLVLREGLHPQLAQLEEGGDLTITIDVQEKEPILKAIAGAQHRRLAHLENPAFSYDYEVLTAAGQLLRLERKSCIDAVNSFLTPYVGHCCRLCRQARSVDALIIEWSEHAELAARSRFTKPHVVESAKKHLWHLALEATVLWTTGPTDTLRLLHYLEKKTTPFNLRSNPQPPLQPQRASAQSSSQSPASAGAGDGIQREGGN